MGKCVNVCKLEEVGSWKLEAESKKAEGKRQKAKVKRQKKEEKIIG